MASLLTVFYYNSIIKSLWAEVYGNQIDTLIEPWISIFIPILTLNKVMSSNATHAIKFLFMNVQSPRLISCLIEGFAHKHAAVRRACTENLYFVCKAWGSELLEKHSKQLLVWVCKMVKDSDAEVRQLARFAFWGFHTLFPAITNDALAKEEKKTQAMLIEFAQSSPEIQELTGGNVVTSVAAFPKPASVTGTIRKQPPGKCFFFFYAL
jgi:hypothetical protein